MFATLGHCTRCAIAKWTCMVGAVIALGIVACGEEPTGMRSVSRLKLDVSPKFPYIETTDHYVPHVSTVPANAGQSISLHLLERRATNRDNTKVVLMTHGASVPAPPGYDLRTDHYDWALSLAQSAGFDVFMLDLQGSGKSTRPKMDNPCNVPKADQTRALIPYQIPATCNAQYPFTLNSSKSDWDELDTVVEYIRDLRKVDKVNLISWSQGSFRIGPYSVLHPEKVESLFMYAPLYNPVFRSGVGPGGFGAPVSLPQPGTPMSLRTKGDLLALWNGEDRCEGQLEPGIQDTVWHAIMENDDLGSTWGAPPAGASEGSDPEGVMRVRTPFQWGWNQGMASRVTVPLLIIQGEFDKGDGGIQALAELYQTVQSPQKLRFRVQCAGHRMVWESQRKILHHISKEWIKHASVAGFETGEFFVDTEGNLSAL
jgi:pimeloyl-ACP methyl ester carboxylesterase